MVKLGSKQVEGSDERHPAAPRPGADGMASPATPAFQCIADMAAKGVFPLVSLF